MNKTVFTTLAVLLLSGSAVAQNQDNWQTWPLADHFTVSANAFFQNLDTRIRLDASDASPGTTVDFEHNLGMSDTETLPGLSIGCALRKNTVCSLRPPT